MKRITNHPILMSLLPSGCWPKYLDQSTVQQISPQLTKQRGEEDLDAAQSKLQIFLEQNERRQIRGMAICLYLYLLPRSSAQQQYVIRWMVYGSEKIQREGDNDAWEAGGTSDEGAGEQ